MIIFLEYNLIIINIHRNYNKIKILVLFFNIILATIILNLSILQSNFRFHLRFHQNGSIPYIVCNDVHIPYVYIIFEIYLSLLGMCLLCMYY